MRLLRHLVGTGLVLLLSSTLHGQIPGPSIRSLPIGKFSMHEGTAWLGGLSVQHRSAILVELLHPPAWSDSTLQQMTVALVKRRIATKQRSADDDLDDVDSQDIVNCQGREMQSGHLRYWFVLYPGTYQVAVKMVPEEGAEGAELPEAARSAEWRGHIEVTRRPIEKSLVLVQNWLKGMHLDQDFELIGSYDERSPDGSIPVAVRQHYAQVLTLIGLEREMWVWYDNDTTDERPAAFDLVDEWNEKHGPPRWASATGTVGIAPGEITNWRTKDRTPLYLVVLRYNRSKGDLQRTEHLFQKLGDSMWDRILRKIALSVNIPSYRVAAYLSQEGDTCFAREIFDVMPGEAKRVGSVCQIMVTGSAIVHRFRLKTPPAESLTQRKETKIETNVMLSESVANFFERIPPPKRKGRIPGTDIEFGGGHRQKHSGPRDERT